MPAAESMVHEGYLVLDPIKYNGKRYPQNAKLLRDELDETTAEKLILAGVIDVATWEDESIPISPETPVIEAAHPSLDPVSVASDAAENPVKPPKPKKPAKPAAASQE
jgi:hypothetical protein